MNQYFCFLSCLNASETSGLAVIPCKESKRTDCSSHTQIPIRLYGIHIASYYFEKIYNQGALKEMILEMTRPVQGGLRQERKLEAVSNNLANSDTTGFKKDTISFDKKFKAQINKDFSQGSIRTTGNPLDFALTGEGFFKVETPEGIKYTRNGNFSLDVNGIIVDQDGNPILGQGGAIAIDAGNEKQDFQVSQAGEIYHGGEVIDTFDIVTFKEKNKLQRDGNNLLSYNGDTTDEVQVAQVNMQQKAIEQSNTKVVEEMARMIDYHRMFETFTKSMMTFDEVDSKAINDVGKLR